MTIMRSYLHLIVTVVAAASFATTAYAQDDPRFGVTMGYPGAVGVLWRVAERVAIRPEVTATRGSGDSASTDIVTSRPGTTTELDNWQIGVGVSGLFYLTSEDTLRTYVAPRVAYTRTSSSSGPAGAVVSSRSDGRAYNSSASFGAEYSLGRRFGVFGEAGVNYSTATTHGTTVQTVTSLVPGATGGLVSTTSTLSFESEGHSRTISLRGGAGVIVYLGR